MKTKFWNYRPHKCSPNIFLFSEWINFGNANENREVAHNCAANLKNNVNEIFDEASNFVFTCTRAGRSNSSIPNTMKRLS